MAMGPVGAVGQTNEGWVGAGGGSALQIVYCWGWRSLQNKNRAGCGVGGGG